MEDQELLPLAKKQKVNDERLMDIETVTLNLYKHCLCQLPDTCMLNVFSVADISSWSKDRLLNFLSFAHLICDITLQQVASSTLCPGIKRLSEDLVANRTGIVNEIVTLVSHSDPYISYTASHALSYIFLCSNNNLQEVWVQQLTDLLCLQSPRTLDSVISVFNSVLCRRDASITDLNKIKLPENCFRVKDFEDHEFRIVKLKIIKVLQPHWKMIVMKFIRYISSFDLCADVSIEQFNHKTGHNAIIEFNKFIKMWTSIVSIKTSLDVMVTKYFYADLQQMLILLRRPRIHPDIWKNIINLFNESLCYSTALAVQGTMQEEPCILARELVKAVKTKNMLNNMPFRKGTRKYGGGKVDGDKELLQDTILLIFKAVATIIKETKNDSSDSSSEETEDSEEIDAEMAIIESSVNDVLRKVDLCVEECMSFQPGTPTAQWIVQLFADRTFVLIQSMICTLDISSVLCYRRNSMPRLRDVLNPTLSLVEFLQIMSYNNDINSIIFELLLGDDSESQFLLYIWQILKFICNRWNEFCLRCDTKLQSTMAVLMDLMKSLDNLIRNKLEPYNLNPIMRLLVRCKELYTGVSGMNI